jgi:hypothetical protein
MNILNELLMLSEAKEKNLIGLTINKKKITEETPSEPWPGNFDCYNEQLTSLKGSPKEIGGIFNCQSNLLNSLKYAPEKTGSYFDCSGNNLTSLKNGPKEIGDYFDCSDNKITSLKGCPKEISGNFYSQDNLLTSLKDINKVLRQMNGIFYADHNPIKSNVIGLLLVKGCKEIKLDNKQVEEIMNRHLKSPFGNKRVIECQSEMLEADLGEWAEL